MVGLKMYYYKTKLLTVHKNMPNEPNLFPKKLLHQSKVIKVGTAARMAISIIK